MLFEEGRGRPGQRDRQWGERRRACHHPWKRKASLDTILSTVERGFAAVAGDVADIKSTMATKADVRNIVGEELAPIRAELKSIRLDLDDLKEKVESVTGFHKEIDHALERIANIEKHLGPRQENRRLKATKPLRRYRPN